MCFFSVFGLFEPKLEPEIIYFRGDVRLDCSGGVIFLALGLVWDFFFPSYGGGWGGDIGKLHWENIRPWWGQPSWSLFVRAQPQCAAL